MANISTGIKLAIAGVVIAAATAYMAFLGASSSWQYYVTVQECVKKSPRFTGQRIRVSGTIVPGTLKPTPDGASFLLGQEDSKLPAGKLPVVYKGSLPDDLSPEKSMEVVVEGRLEDPCTLHGDKLITKCASKYDAQKEELTATARAPGTPGRRNGEVVR